MPVANDCVLIILHHRRVARLAERCKVALKFCASCQGTEQKLETPVLGEAATVRLGNWYLVKEVW